MEIVLIRHGESEGNILGVHQVWKDSELTELGRRQSRITQKRFEGIMFNRIISSDSIRTI